MISKQPHPRKQRGCGCSVLLILLACIPLYFSMFWGWASGAGSPPNASQLKEASNWAFGVTATMVVAAALVTLISHRKGR